MSRDQTIPLLSAMALYGMKGRVFQYVLGHAKRLFLFTTNTTPNWSYPVLNRNTLAPWQRVKFFFGWNPGFPVYAFKLPDITVFDFWALEMRGLYSRWCWPLFFPILCLFDLQTLIGSALKVYSYGKNPTNSDDRNHINALLVGLQICPTPVIKFAAKLYSKRPRCGFSSLAGGNGVQSALDSYYQSDDSPPFNVLAEPIVGTYFT